MPAYLCVYLLNVLRLLLFAKYKTSHQHASVSQRLVCSDNCTGRHTEVADLTQSHFSDTRPTSSSYGPVTQSAGQSSHWSIIFSSHWCSSSSSPYARWRCLLPSRRRLSSSAPPGCHTACPSDASVPAMCPASQHHVVDSAAVMMDTVVGVTRLDEISMAKTRNEPRSADLGAGVLPLGQQIGQCATD